MGISKSSEHWLREIFSRALQRISKDSPRLLTLGRQELEGVGLESESWFMRQGFVSVESLDVSAAEGATHVFDLNESVPESICRSYDIVYDGGTMEHVFDVRMFLSNCVRLVAPQGCIIHSVPVNNFVNHGFWQISPTALLAFYRANGFQALGVGFYFSQKILRKEGGFYWASSEQEILRLMLSCRIVFPQAFDSNYLLTMTVVVQLEREVDQIVSPIQPFYASEFAFDHFTEMKRVLNFIEGR
jgi:hypothetical protein